MRTLIIIVLSLLICSTLHAGPAVQLGDGVNLRASGNADYTISLRSGRKLKTVADPIMLIDGIEIGHWPAKVVTYVLQNGTYITCHADGPQGDTHKISIYHLNGRLTRITGVNKKVPKVRRYSKWAAAITRRIEPKGYVIHLYEIPGRGLKLKR